MEDPEVHNLHQATELEAMLGNVLLVRGIIKPLDQEKTAKVYLPKGGSNGWYELSSGEYYDPGAYDVNLDLDKIPAYFHAGTIVPTKSRIRRNSACMKLDPHT